ncbi:Ceramidase [Trinorchestia longiramus]|nr:Ceramidase [Trinorchestia longiramus]
MFLPENITKRWLAAGSSPIDWCEENYIVSSKIAEFNNTFSNAAFIILPLYLWLSKSWQSYCRLVSVGPYVFYSLVMATGIFSVYFHASLSFLGQLLDEVSILWLSPIGYAFFTPKKYRPVFISDKCFVILGVIISALLTACWFIDPALNTVWMFPMLLPAFLMGSRELSTLRTGAVLTHGLVAFVLASVAVISWLSDRYWCNLILKTGAPGLHFVWHLAIGWSAHYAITVFAYLRAVADAPHIRSTFARSPNLFFGLPFIHCQEKVC